MLSFIRWHRTNTLFRFGWVNASYILGLSILTAHQRRAIGTLTNWDTFHTATSSLDIAGRDLGTLNNDEAIVQTPAETQHAQSTHERPHERSTQQYDPYEMMHIANGHANNGHNSNGHLASGQSSSTHH